MVCRTVLQGTCISAQSQTLYNLCLHCVNGIATLCCGDKASYCPPGVTHSRRQTKLHKLLPNRRSQSILGLLHDNARKLGQDNSKRSRHLLHSPSRYTHGHDQL